MKPSDILPIPDYPCPCGTIIKPVGDPTHVVCPKCGLRSRVKIVFPAGTPIEDIWRALGIDDKPKSNRN